MSNQLITLDVFKFVALRPAQRIKEPDTAPSFIRDTRSKNEDGQQILTELVHELADPSAELQYRLQKELQELAPFTAAWEAVQQIVADLDPDHAFDANELLAKAADPIPEDYRIEALAWAWNAVYAAYLSGPNAGPKLEAPTAALRWLHVTGLAEAQQLPTRAAFETALTATPIIDLPSVTEDEEAGGGTQDAPTTPTENGRYSQLIDEIVITQSLLATMRNPQTQQAITHEVTSQEQGATLQRTNISIGNIPHLQTVMTAPSSEPEQRVLSQIGITEATTLPVATNAIETHLTQLNREAYGLRNNPQFTAMVLKSGNADLVRLLPPATKLDPYLPYPFLKTGNIKDVDVRNRIKPLGIGDLKVVKQTLLAYQPGEVAHIENVLKGEFKERKHRVLDRTETILFQSEEETKETERDTQTTDRFELKREAEKTIKEDMSVSAGLTVTGGFGPVSITAQGDFAYSTSQQESTKNSANFAREVVERSVSKIQKKVKTEQTKKNLHEVEEINTHGLENREGAGHIIGVYRWVDKKYRAQVYNYGVRLMIEFIVPEPAAYFRASLLAAKQITLNAKPPEPFLDQKGGPLTPSDINASNYELFAARYNATGITPPPPTYLYVSTAFEQSGLQNGQTFSKSVKDLVLPDGYIWDHYQADVSALYENYPQFSLQIGDIQHHLLNNQTARRAWVGGMGVYWGGAWEDDPRGIIPVSAVGYDINAYMVHVSVCCRRTNEHYQKWQLSTFDKIYTAYKALQTEYDQKLAQAQAQQGAIVIEGRNPAMNRDIEKRELKKLCLTLLTGKHFNNNNAMVYPSATTSTLPEVDVYEALAEGPVIQFFEQAFDWEQITYLFYPYFWAQKAQWLATSNLTDPDPLFGHFLQAGAARVVVPVPMAYKDAILYYLETGKIWQGGETPRLNDPLYISIHEELRNRTDDLANATPEGTSWEFTLPTTLVWLQSNSDLPTFAE